MKVFVNGKRRYLPFVEFHAIYQKIIGLKFSVV